MTEKTWEFRLWQFGTMLAEGSGSRDDMAREVMHYAAQYGQDGDVAVLVGPEGSLPDSPPPEAAP